MATKDGIIEQHFTLAPRGEVSLRSHAGEITVRGWSGPTVRVRASSDDDELALDDLRFSQTSNHLSITSNSGTGGMMSIDYEIDLPADCRISVSAMNGEVRIERTGAGGDINTPAGDVELIDLVGDYSVKTASGDLSVEGLRGYLAFQTASGDAEIERSHLTGFNFESANADVDVETTLSPHGDYRFQTIAGDLKLLIPATTRATVKLNTQEGEVDCELPANIVRSSRRHWEAILNGGGAVVQMHSLTGDLTIEETSDLDDLPVNVEVEEPAATSEESTTILEALSRGEIDVEEAMAQLDRLSV